MPRKSSQARTKILHSAADLLKRAGAETLTIEGTASQAGVAKGLVHYHFKTKQLLLCEVLKHVSTTRCAAWSEAFDADSPTAVVDQTWALLTQESDAGVLRAWHSLLGLEHILTDQTAKATMEGFSSTLADALQSMLDRNMGLEPSVPKLELGWLAAAVVNGMGVQLMAGGDRTELEGAYAAAWLGILSLTRPPT
jgi:AcrR family transcriptional regulator